ncbi:MAG: hypothetical protein MUC48_04970 [Leptolyngbya sp. Prado105]|jgi:hypothetical protein|nr:hypothetical protein [Leptolyngbya sp. Prado105]
MTMLVFAFICGLIAAPLIKVNLDDRLIQFTSSGFDQAKGLARQGVEIAWKHYQDRQKQELTVSNGAVPQRQELIVLPQPQEK